MRRFPVTNEKIIKILNGKADISKRQVEITKKMEELEKEYNTNMGLYKRIDERVRPLLKKEFDKIEMGEFEEVSRVHQNEKDLSWTIEVANRLEEWKLSWKNRFDNQEKEVK